MVIDIHGKEHRPAGLPRKVAGTYTGASAFGDDKDMQDAYRHPGATRVRREWKRRLRADPPDTEWMRAHLAATEPVRDKDGTIIADWRGEPPIGDDDYVRLYNKAVYGSEKGGEGGEKLGRIFQKFNSVIASRPTALRLAEEYALETLDGLKRSCLIDPTKSFSARLVGAALMRAPARLERQLARPPYNLSAHRMRVGMRFKHAVNQWEDNHGGRHPNARERDRIWDDTMRSYIAEKKAKGVSHGRGLTLSNGHAADPDALKNGDYIRRDRNGNIVNGRRDFEIMSAQVIADLQRRDESYDAREEWTNTDESEGVTTGSAYTAARNETDELHNAWILAKDRGMDMQKFVDYLNLPAGLVAQWEAEY